MGLSTDYDYYVRPLLELEKRRGSSKEKEVRGLLSGLSDEKLVQVIDGAFAEAPTTKMLEVCQRVISTDRVSQLARAKGCTTDIDVMAKRWQKFLPVRTQVSFHVGVRQGALEALGWFGKLLQTLFLTLTRSYNIDVERAPTDQYQAQSQMMFIKSAIADAAWVVAIVGAAFVVNIFAGVAAVIACLLLIAGSILLHRWLANRLPKEISDCVNWTAKAERGEIVPATGREIELQQIISALSHPSRKDGANIMLLGEPGVGKSLLPAELARRIAAKEVPDSLKGKTVFFINTAQLLSNEQRLDRKEWRAQNPLSHIFNMVKGYERDVIFFFDEVHAAAKAQDDSSGGSPSLTELLKTELERRNICCIVATTTKEYEAKLARNEAFVQRFSKILVAPPSPEELRLILLRRISEEESAVDFPTALVDYVIAKADEAAKEQSNPRKSCRLLHQVISHVSSWRPTKLEAKLAKLKLQKEQHIAAGAEKSRADGSWIFCGEAEEHERALEAIEQEIKACESAQKSQRAVRERIQELRRLGLDNQDKRALLVTSLAKGEKRAEFVLRHFFFERAIQTKIDALKTEFQTNYGEVYVDTVTREIIDLWAERMRAA